MAQAKAQAAQNPNFSLVIYGDGKVPYEAIIHLLDSCKQAGITRVGLVAEQAAPHAAQ